MQSQKRQQCDKVRNGLPTGGQLNGVRDEVRETQNESDIRGGQCKQREALHQRREERVACLQGSQRICSATRQGGSEYRGVPQQKHNQRHYCAHDDGRAHLLDVAFQIRRNHWDDVVVDKGQGQDGEACGNSRPVCLGEVVELDASAADQ